MDPLGTFTHDELILQKLKVAARRQLSAQMAHDAEMRTWMEPMTDRLVMELRTHVYGHKVDSQEIRLPFEKSETVTIPSPRRLLWTYGLVVLLGMILTFAATSWPAFAVTAAVALAWVVTYVANPPLKVTVVAAGEAVVKREQFNTFPDNTMVYPPELGGAVRMSMISQRDIYYHRD